MNSLARTAIAKHHRLGWLKEHFSLNSVSRETTVKVRGCQFPPKPFFFFFFVYPSRMALFLCPSLLF